MVEWQAPRGGPKLATGSSSGPIAAYLARRTATTSDMWLLEWSTFTRAARIESRSFTTSLGYTRLEG